LPDRIEVQIGVNADDLDNRLMAGSIDFDVAGTGVQAAAAAKIQSSPTLKKNADSAPTARLNYISMSQSVPPFDNTHCRRAMQQGLQKVGIKTEIKKYPQGDYFKLYAGNPGYVKKNGLGLISMSWGADWTEGFGYLSQIVDSRVIRDAGNTNLGVTDPEVDK